MSFIVSNFLGQQDAPIDKAKFIFGIKSILNSMGLASKVVPI
jgi:hypothetical protein